MHAGKSVCWWKKTSIIMMIIKRFFFKNFSFLYKSLPSNSKWRILEKKTNEFSPMFRQILFWFQSSGWNRADFFIKLICYFFLISLDWNFFLIHNCRKYLNSKFLETKAKKIIMNQMLKFQWYGILRSVVTKEFWIALKFFQIDIF